MNAAGVFVITGLPGSGKSTLAHALAQALQAPLLSKDSIKEPLLDVLGAADRSASRRLSDASFAVLFALAAQQLRYSSVLVLEGNFRPGEHERPLRALLEPHAPLKCAQLLCRVPEPLRQSRLLARSADPARHPGHRDAEWGLAARHGDAFLELPGPCHVHDGAADLAVTDAWIRSLVTAHLV